MNSYNKPICIQHSTQYIGISNIEDDRSNDYYFYGCCFQLPTELVNCKNERDEYHRVKHTENKQIITTLMFMIIMNKIPIETNSNTREEKKNEEEYGGKQNC